MQKKSSPFPVLSKVLSAYNKVLSACHGVLSACHGVLSACIPFAIIAVATLTLLNCQTQKINEEEFLLYSTFDVLSQNHFADRKTDAAFFDRTLDIYLSMLDPEKIFFLRGEVSNLRKSYTPKNDLDPIFGLVDTVEATLKKRTADYVAYSENKLKTLLDLSKNETFETDSAKRKFSRNEKALEKAWLNQLKSSLVRELSVKLLPDSSVKSSAQDSSLHNQDLVSLQRKQQDELWQQIQRANVNIFQTRARKQYLETYLKALSLTFDRHTSYYPPIEKENFDISMRGELEGIGAQITKAADGYIEVIKIIPGGPSAKQKELEAGDKIMKVGQGKNELVDIKSLSLNQGLKLIRGKKGTQVRLMVKKKTEEVKIISIIRDRIVLEEKFARSAVFELDGKRIGYLLLPSFYNDFSGKSARTSTADVKKELEYLASQNVEGLVFDVRGNAGGALSDAVNISGLFFPDGPVVNVRDNRKQETPLVDTDSSVAFDAPMVVLVDYASASASEILAGALQDYGRAVVVGTDKTFGKGTVQVIVSLNDYYGARVRNLPLGSIRFTTRKFYRVTGVSTQAIGVSSDIVIPSMMEPFSEDSEKLYGLIENDSINPILYERWKNYTYNIAKVRNKSKKRIQKNENFQNIVKRRSIIEEYQENTKRPLSIKKALDERKKHLEQLAKHPVDLSKEFAYEDVFYKKADAGLEGTSQRQELLDSWVDDLKTDPILNESIKILMDIEEDVAS